MLNFPFRQTFYFTLKCNIAVQNIVKKANVKNILKKNFAYLPTLKNIQMFPETRCLFFWPYLYTVEQKYGQIASTHLS